MFNNPSTFETRKFTFQYQIFVPFVIALLFSSPPLPPLEGKPRKKKNSFHVALVGIDRARHLGREKKISCIPRYSCRNLSYVRKTRTANNLSPAINISIQLVSKRISFNQYYWFSSQLDLVHGIRLPLEIENRYPKFFLNSLMNYRGKIVTRSECCRVSRVGTIRKKSSPGEALDTRKKFSLCHLVHSYQN